MPLAVWSEGVAIPAAVGRDLPYNFDQGGGQVIAPAGVGVAFADHASRSAVKDDGVTASEAVPKLFVRDLHSGAPEYGDVTRLHALDSGEHLEGGGERGRRRTQLARREQNGASARVLRAPTR